MRSRCGPLFLGAAINDIYNFLIITGDPIPSTARQTVKAVFNSDSTGLMKITKEMNEDVFAKNPLCYGGAINQGRKNLDVEIGRVKKKMEEGAEFFLTQPVFTEEDAARLRRIKDETGARILCGIMPLISRKNAMFMKNEIAGVNVTDEIVARYPEKASRKEGEAVGIQLAKEVMKLVEDFADGYYFSFPFNRVYMLKDICNCSVGLRTCCADRNKTGLKAKSHRRSRFEWIFARNYAMHPKGSSGGGSRRCEGTEQLRIF